MQSGLPSPHFERTTLMRNGLYFGMARGWESKSVEAQQAEAIEEKTPRTKLSPEQAAQQRRIEGLELSRQRVLQQLAAAGNPGLRQMFEHALAELDGQINALKSSS
jgi:hypothetical protein